MGTHLGHHLPAGAHFTLRTTRTHIHTRRKWESADLRDDPGLCGLLRAPHRESPAILVLTESSDAVVAVNVSANVPKDHIEDEEYGEDEERYEDGLGHRRDERLHVRSRAGQSGVGLRVRPSVRPSSVCRLRCSPPPLRFAAPVATVEDGARGCFAARGHTHEESDAHAHALLRDGQFMPAIRARNAWGASLAGGSA